MRSNLLFFFSSRRRHTRFDCDWSSDVCSSDHKPKYELEKRDALIRATLETKPKGMTHWSCRTMAKAQGVSKSTVNRLWQLHNLKPHLSRTFKLSRDPKFIEKLTDVVGLYLNPPQKGIVLCVDEKSQIQALDRTQPGQIGRASCRERA